LPYIAHTKSQFCEVKITAYIASQGDATNQVMNKILLENAPSTFFSYLGGSMNNTTHTTLTTPFANKANRSKTPAMLLLTALLTFSSFYATANETTNILTMSACKIPEYDAQMLSKEETGKVKLRFTTDVQGKVLDAKIEESSGSINLDKASLIALKNCQFKPAKSIELINKASNLIAFAWSIK
jgi:TonB family protein